MNNKGRISGILLVIILIVALPIAFLAMKQMSRIGFGNVSDQMQQENLVEQTQDAVDAINDRMRNYESFWAQYLNPRVIIAYAIFFGATFLSIFAYKVVPLSMGPILEATGYIYVTVFGVVIFKERITGGKVVALALMIGGIVVYALFG